MSNEDKHSKGPEGEGNPLLNGIGISATGEVTFVGKHADKPIITEADGVRTITTKDGKVLGTFPIQERDDEWFEAFKDPNPGDIEVLPTEHIATGRLYKGPGKKA